MGLFCWSIELNYGYARVSTEDQNLSLQLNALKCANCVRIFTDQGISGNVRDRPGLSQALETLEMGDTLVVWRLDRLGRSLIDLIQLVDKLGQRNIHFRSLTECIDTETSGGRLVFHMMGALAEFERSLISERTRAGMKAAQKRGIHVGRPPALSPREAQEAAKAVLEQGLQLAAVAEKYKVTPRSLRQIIRACAS